MRRFFALAALSLSIPANAGADVAVATGNLMSAMLVEWMVAHCQQDQIPPASISLASMVINGSEKSEVELMRGAVHDHVKRTYSNDTAACAALLSTLK